MKYNKFDLLGAAYFIGLIIFLFGNKFNSIIIKYKESLSFFVTLSGAGVAVASILYTNYRMKQKEQKEAIQHKNDNIEYITLVGDTMVEELVAYLQKITVYIDAATNELCPKNKSSFKSASKKYGNVNINLPHVINFKDYTILTKFTPKGMKEYRKFRNIIEMNDGTGISIDTLLIIYITISSSLLYIQKEATDNDLNLRITHEAELMFSNNIIPEVKKFDPKKSALKGIIEWIDLYENNIIDEVPADCLRTAICIHTNKIIYGAKFLANIKKRLILTFKIPDSHELLLPDEQPNPYLYIFFYEYCNQTELIAYYRMYNIASSHPPKNNSAYCDKIQIGKEKNTLFNGYYISTQEQ